MGIERRWQITVGLIGFLTAWILTAPPLLGFINWDQGAYISGFATARLTWSTPPWNAHFAIGQLYWLAAKGIGALGGTAIDGFRFANALAFGVAVVLVARLMALLVGGRWQSLLFTAVWATSWVNLFLILSLEDNVLYLPFAAGVISLCARRVDDWGPRDSICVAVLAACAALISWQALLYAGPAFYVAAVGGSRTKAVAQRARDVALFVASFFGTLVLWCLFVGLTSSLKTRHLIGSMFTRPTGNFTIRSVTQVRQILHVLGTAASYLLLHDYSHTFSPPALPVSQLLLGAMFLALVLTLLILASLEAIRRQSWVAHVLAATLALFVIVTPLYRDLGFRYLIRFDFLPLLAIPLLGSMLARWRADRLKAAVLIAVCVVQLALALRWDVRRHAYYQAPTRYAELPHPEPAWYGRDGKSWFQYFRGVRRKRPAACLYVLDLREIWDASWQFDLTASLFSELPNHLALGDPAQVRGWRFPPRVVRPAEARTRRLIDESCASVSSDARRLLDSVPAELH